MKDLESSLQQKKDDIARLEEERTDLIAKVLKTYQTLPLPLQIKNVVQKIRLVTIKRIYEKLSWKVK